MASKYKFHQFENFNSSSGVVIAKIESERTKFVYLMRNVREGL